MSTKYEDVAGNYKVNAILYDENNDIIVNEKQSINMTDIKDGVVTFSTDVKIP